MPLEQFRRASCLAGTSFLHRCDARVKIAFLLAFLITTALLPFGAWVVYLLLAGILAVIFLISELPFKPLFKNSLILEFPILLVLIPQIFLRKGEMMEINIFSKFGFPVSLEGINNVANLMVRSWFSLQLTVLVSAVTSFEDMLAGLRACGLPRLLVEILALMWRYLFIMLDEVERMQRARTARSAMASGGRRKIGGTLFWRASVTGSMVGSLLLRSMKRSQCVHQAMLSRGYDGEIRTSETKVLSNRERRWLLAFVIGGLLLILIANEMVY